MCLKLKTLLDLFLISVDTLTLHTGYLYEGSTWGQHQDTARASWTESGTCRGRRAAVCQRFYGVCHDQTRAAEPPNNQSGVLLAAGKRPQPALLPLPVHPSHEDKRKKACQTEVKSTAGHSSSEENYNYQVQHHTNAQMLATDLRLCLALLVVSHFDVIQLGQQ